MRRWKKGVGLLVALIGVGVLIYFGVHIRIEDVGQEASGGGAKGSEHGCFDDAQEVTVAAVENSISTANARCLISSIEQIQLGNNSAQKYEAAKFLGGVLNTYYRGGTPAFFDNVYVRFVALNLVVPRVVAKDITMDIGGVRKDLVDQAGKANGPTLSLGLLVLSQFRDDRDLALFEKAVQRGGDEVVWAAVMAVALNCSAAAKAVLGRLLAASNVRAYLDRYRDKETLTKFIHDNCPV